MIKRDGKREMTWRWEVWLTVMVCWTFVPDSPIHNCLGGRVHCTVLLLGPGGGKGRRREGEGAREGEGEGEEEGTGSKRGSRST